MGGAQRRAAPLVHPSSQRAETPVKEKRKIEIKRRTPSMNEHWNLEDIYPSEQAWSEDLAATRQLGD